MKKHVYLSIGFVLFAVCLTVGAAAQPANPVPAEPYTVFLFGAGVHRITAEELMTGQQVLKDALDCGGTGDPNDMLVFEGTVQAGGDLLWWVSGESISVTDVFAEFEVAQTLDSGGDEVVVTMLEVGLENGENWYAAHLMVLRDDTLGVGAAFPITTECWDGFFPSPRVCRRSDPYRTPNRRRSGAMPRAQATWTRRRRSHRAPNRRWTGAMTGSHPLLAKGAASAGPLDALRPPRRGMPPAITWRASRLPTTVVRTVTDGRFVGWHRGTAGRILSI